jgi:16S rRNA (cytosine1402-N4)-methyltransferase
MDALAIRPDGVYVDATLGGGGHFSELSSRLSSLGKAVGIDRDPDAIAWFRAHKKDVLANVILEHAPFSQVTGILDKHGISKVDGLLIDCGVSSHQIDDATRGFSYMQNAVLDMRMDSTTGNTASEFIAMADEAELSRVLCLFGEVTNPGRMARCIKDYHEKIPIRLSKDLTNCLRQEYGQNLQIKVIAKVFQALRIAVNQELDELVSCLKGIVPYLSLGGHIVVIAYHSLEDRIVKTFIRDMEYPCICPPKIPYCVCGKTPMLKRVNKKVIVPTDQEIIHNTRARSARMRIAEKV